MTISAYHCPQCKTSITGEFESTGFHQLDKSELNFVEIFITSRGNIKEVESRLGISYPTVRKSLDRIIEKLEQQTFTEEKKATILQTPTASDKKVALILSDLKEGKITAEKALHDIENIREME